MDAHSRVGSDGFNVLADASVLLSSVRSKGVDRLSSEEQVDSKFEDSLRETWSIGPLRPWLRLLAERQFPDALRGKVDPSDVVQQTLMDAWQGQHNFRGTTHAERLAWLRTILTRRIIRCDRDLLQTAKRGQGIEKTLQAAIDRDSLCIENLAASQGPGPASAADHAEQSLRLASAIDQLPEDYRRVLTLRHVDGLPHDKVAEKLGRSAAAVRMLWIRALEALKKQYGDP